ncbi:hypothetical protein HZR84_06210 [Hyphobacterium sp. CCMP332]|nr:hypothetical protein HZR84_06210 [Hyphobacterium sp. CCMP332]
MGNTLKVLLSIILQALMGYFLALYVIHLFETPDRFQPLIAAGFNVLGVWGMGFFLEGLNNHLEGIHLLARLIASVFCAFIGVIILFIFGTTHWMEIPIMPLIGALIGYHFIFFIKVRRNGESEPE